MYLKDSSAPAAAAAVPAAKTNPFDMAKKTQKPAAAAPAGGAASADDAPTVSFGIDDSSHDGEGRAITVEYTKFFVVALYVPNSGMKLERLDCEKNDEFCILKRGIAYQKR